MHMFVEGPPSNWMHLPDYYRYFSPTFTYELLPKQRVKMARGKVNDLGHTRLGVGQEGFLAPQGGGVKPGGFTSKNLRLFQKGWKMGLEI